MNERLRNLYEFPDNNELALMELVENCAVLEGRALQLIDALSWEDRAVFESWIDLRNELEVQTVKKALRVGSKLGKGYGTLNE